MQQLPFPPQNERELFDVLQFIKKSPFAKDYWKVLKSWYKTAETALIQNDATFKREEMLNIIGNLLYRIDQERWQDLSSTFPTQATLAYMKRRGRKFMRFLSETDEEAYFAIVSKLIAANAPKTTLDYENQWITIDALFGKSRRFIQTSYRSSYLYDKTKFHWHQIESYHTTIWDKKLSFLLDLLTQPLPWQIHEFALKVLYRNNALPTKISEETLLHFLKQPSVWLKKFAVYRLYETYTYQGLKPELYAGLWLYATPSLKKEVLRITDLRPKMTKQWEDNFAKSLASYVLSDLERGNNSGRIVQAIEYLQKHFPKKLADFTQRAEDALKIAYALLNSGNQVLINLALDFAKNTVSSKSPSSIFIFWLYGLGEKNKQNDEIYKRLSKILLDKFSNSKLYRHEIEPYIFRNSFYICDFGWRLSKNLRSDYYLYNILYKITNYHRYSRGVKEIHLLNMIQSEAGVEAFIRYYTQYSYSISHIPTNTYHKIFEFGLPSLKEGIINITQKVFTNQRHVLHYLTKLDEAFPEQIRNQVFAAVLPTLAGKEVIQYGWDVRQVAYWDLQERAWLREALFQILEVSKIRPEIAYDFINRITGQPQNVPFFFDFLQKTTAQKQKLFLNELAKSVYLLEERSALIPEEFLVLIFKNLNSSTLTDLINKATEDSWQKIQKLAYERLQNFAQEPNFWKNILEKVQDVAQANLRKRLLEDELFVTLFHQQKDTSVLDITQADFEEILLRWIKANTYLFKPNTAEIFKICTHKLDSLRTWGLDFAFKQGLTPLMCLQFLESLLPETMQVAKAYLDSIRPNSEQELETALMLMDSPAKSVRVVALDFIGLRKKHFVGNRNILRFLAEHSDSGVQAFVAEELNKAESDLQQEKFVQQFDAEILRMHNRSRKAKEAVKNRVQTSLKIDKQVLLAMAQGSTKQDAEWAIVQLTKLALAGEEIEGFSLE